jgi:hypothetical protein
MSEGEMVRDGVAEPEVVEFARRRQKLHGAWSLAAAAPASVPGSRALPTKQFYLTALGDDDVQERARRTSPGDNWRL